MAQGGAAFGKMRTNFLFAFLQGLPQHLQNRMCANGRQFETGRLMGRPGLQSMSVGTADDPERMRPGRDEPLFHPPRADLHRMSLQFRRKKSQAGKHRIRGLVDVRRDGNAASLAYLLKNRFDGKGNGVDQQFVHLAGHPVLLVQNQLVAENLRLVGHRREGGVQLLSHIQRRCQVRKEGQHVDLLRRGNLDGRNDQNPLLRAEAADRRQILGAVVVTDRKDRQLQNPSHADDIVGCHLIFPTGRKAGMEVQVVRD